MDNTPEEIDILRAVVNKYEESYPFELDEIEIREQMFSEVSASHQHSGSASVSSASRQSNSYYSRSEGEVNQFLQDYLNEFDGSSSYERSVHHLPSRRQIPIYFLEAIAKLANDVRDYLGKFRWINPSDLQDGTRQLQDEVITSVYMPLLKTLVHKK